MPEKGLARLSNGKTANNIKDYLKLKSELQDILHKSTTTYCRWSSADHAEPRPSISSMLNTEVTNRSLVWYKGPEAVYLSNIEANAKTSQQCCFSSITSLEARPNIKPILLYENESDINEFYYSTKSRYRFGSLEVYTHINVINCNSGTWQQIPDGYVTDMLQTLANINVRVVGSKESYINKLFKCL